MTKRSEGQMSEMRGMWKEEMNEKGEKKKLKGRKEERGGRMGNGRKGEGE